MREDGVILFQLMLVGCRQQQGSHWFFLDVGTARPTQTCIFSILRRCACCQEERCPYDIGPYITISLVRCRVFRGCFSTPPLVLFLSQLLPPFVSMRRTYIHRYYMTKCDI